MKRGSFVVFTILFSVLLICSSNALSISESERMAEESLPYELTRDLERSGIESVGDIISMTPLELMDYFSDYISDTLRSSFIGIVGVIGIILITSVFKHSVTINDSSTALALELATVLWITYTISDTVGNTTLSAISAIEDAGMFMLSYVPVFSGVATASGLPGSALIYHTTLIWVGQAVSQLARTFLAPLISVFCSVSIAGIISGNSGLSSISGGIKKTVIWSLTLVMIIFVGLVTLQSFMSGITDLSVSRTTKFLIGSFVPVIGGVISDAFTVARNSLLLIKSTVGAVGVGGAALIFVPSLISLFGWRISLAISAVVGEVVEAGLSVKIIKVFSDMISMIIAVILSVAVVFIISTGVILSLGTVM